MIFSTDKKVITNRLAETTIQEVITKCGIAEASESVFPICLMTIKKDGIGILMTEEMLRIEDSDNYLHPGN